MSTPTLEVLKSTLHYEPQTGVFTWLVNRGRNAKSGDIAGCLNSEGYQVIKVKGQAYKAHRLAWFYTFSEWPPEQIDHINRDKTNNRIENLRLATDAQNRQNLPTYSNSKSGYPGVYWHERMKKWQAQITINGVQSYLGTFNSFKEAKDKRTEAELKYHKFQNP